MGAAPGKDPLIGRRFGERGSLILIRKLGHGGMSSVYLAFDVTTQKPHALKLLHDHRAGNPEVIERFRREGATFARLNHENLVQVTETGETDGRLYIVIEYVKGRNLFEIVDSEGPFSVRRALAICSDIAAGLGEAHRNKIVHRDLKPENVMIRDEDQVVKVLDFGIAKDLSPSDDVSLTRMGAYVGTPAYSAPEQIRGWGVDHRADIFSLGVILYEMLTGRVAFGGRHSTEVLRATIHDAPLPITALNKQITTPTALLIDRMIKKDRRERHADMAEVQAEIAALLGAAPDDNEGDSAVRELLKHLFETSA